MERAKCIEAIYEELQDKLVVTIMGACAQELYDLGHKDNFFYLGQVYLVNQGEVNLVFLSAGRDIGETSTPGVSSGVFEFN